MEALKTAKCSKPCHTANCSTTSFWHFRNLWRVDGLCSLGIAKKFGTEAVTQIDAEVWEITAQIEAKNLQKTFQTPENPSIPQVIDLLRKSSLALDQPFKTIEVNGKHAVL